MLDCRHLLLLWAGVLLAGAFNPPGTKSSDVGVVGHSAGYHW